MYWDNVILSKEFDATDLRNSKKNCVLCNSIEKRLDCTKCNVCCDHCTCPNKKTFQSSFFVWNRNDFDKKRTAFFFLVSISITGLLMGF